MEIEIVYPPLARPASGPSDQPTARRRRRSGLIGWARWPFLLAGAVCLLVDLLTGGLFWSPVVLWSLWMVWSFLFSPALVEVNRISQVVKFVVDAVVLLVLIDFLLSPGWAAVVVPVVGCGAMVLVGVLFFTDLERQRQNMMPMLGLAGLSLLLAVAGLIVFQGGTVWPFVVLLATSGTLLLVSTVALGGAFVRELHKRFHV